MLLLLHCPAAVLPVPLTIPIAFLSFALLSEFSSGFDTDRAASRRPYICTKDGMTFCLHKHSSLGDFDKH
jgi:hypothetical protein